MLETCRDRLVNYLKENNLHRNISYSFQNKPSCLTSLIIFLNDIINEYDKSKAVSIFYLNYENTFDEVPHKPLIATLITHAIQRDIVTWIEN